MFKDNSPARQQPQPDATTATPQPRLSKRQCLHCGTPFTPRNVEDAFCCAGCHAVHQLIETQGLNHFYALRQGISEPVSGRAAEPQDWTWLQTLAAQVEQTAATPAVSARVPELELEVDGIHCVGCRWLIGQIFLQQPAHGTIEIDMQAHRICFSWYVAPPESDAQAQAPAAVAATGTATETTVPTAAATTATTADKPANVFSASAFAQALQRYGYLLLDPAVPASERIRAGTGGNATGQNSAIHGSNAGTAALGAAQSARKRLLPRLLLCGVFALNAVLLSLPGQMGMDEETFPLLRLFRLLVFLCATLAVGLTGSYFLRRSLRESGAAGRSAQAGGGKHGASGRAVWQRYDFGRAVAFSLFGCYIAVLLGKAMGLPGAPGAELMAGVSFVLLLLAFIFRK